MTSVIARSMRRLSLHAHDCLDVHGKIDRAEKKRDKRRSKNEIILNNEHTRFTFPYKDLVKVRYS